jgi:hypothetical protein
MKELLRITALVLVAGAALAGGFFGGKATDAGAAGTTVNCAIPNNIVCTVSNPAGIKSVKVMVDFGNLGNIAVVDEAYVSCPKTVNVHWDPIVPNYQFFVEPCLELGLSNGNPPIVGSKLAGIVAFVPAGQYGQTYSPRSSVFFLRNANGGGDPKALGLTSQTPGATAYPDSCGGPYSFIPCDQAFKSLCNSLGGDYIPGSGGTGKCDGAHDWPSDPSPPRP